MEYLETNNNLFNFNYSGEEYNYCSFFHNLEMDELPFMTIRSIQSFLNSGSKYFLYTYKQFNNLDIFNNCPNFFIKDANEIIPEEDFFLWYDYSYAQFSDLFRIKLLNKYPFYIWTDTDNYLFNDHINNHPNVLIIQNNRIQNSYIKISNKEFLYDLNQYINNITIDNIKSGPFNMLGSELYTNIYNQLKKQYILETFEYSKYFNEFDWKKQLNLWMSNFKEEQLIKNHDICILCMSMNLLKRCELFYNKEYLKNNNSYMGILFKEINQLYETKFNRKNKEEN